MCVCAASSSSQPHAAAEKLHLMSYLLKAYSFLLFSVLLVSSSQVSSGESELLSASGWRTAVHTDLLSVGLLLSDCEPLQLPGGNLHPERKRRQLRMMRP